MSLHFIGTTPRYGYIEPGRFDADLQRLGRELPGRKRWHSDKLQFEKTPGNWLAVAQSLSTERWSDDARLAVLDARRVEEQREVMTEQAKAPVSADVAAWNFRRKPFAHQLTALSRSNGVPAFAYLMGMGTGKTFTTINDAANLWRMGLIDTAFVLAPNGVHTQWVTQQVPEHMPNDVTYRALETSTKSLNGSKRDITAFADALTWREGLRIFALNCEALSHESGIKVAERVLKSGKVMLVVDESRRFGNPSADRTKALVKLSKLAPYRRILTGTPITQGLQDLFSQFKILDSNILGHTTFTSYRARYCVMGGFEGRQIIGYQNERELQEKVAPYSMRITKEECLDLPPKVYEVREFLMSDEQRKLYKKMKEEALAELEHKTVDVTVGAAVITKLHQIACGFLMDEEGKVAWRASPNPRITALLDALEEAGNQPTIVWCRFRDDIESVFAALRKVGRKPVTYYGGMTAAQKQDAVEGFMAGRFDAFVGQVDAGGTGLNLQRATHVLYYSNSTNAESRWQSEDRAHRIGQTKTVTYTDLTAKGTVDKRIIQLLKQKESVAVRTLEGVKAILMEDE